MIKGIKMPQRTVGWDIGGAHIKAAVLEMDGTVSNVFQLPCPLWKGIEFLNQSVRQIIHKISDKHCLHAVTMTGELADCFKSREQGVEQIIAAMQNNLSDQDIVIYAGLEGFIRPQDIKTQHYLSIASANWLASASLAANRIKNGLFIDIGSTTSDILVLAESQVKAIGLTDYQRLLSDELVYTGIVRTAVMAVAQTAYFKGQGMGLMAEYFATMADVYRLTGELNEIHDQTETADGNGKTIQASALRLSRMTAYDFCETEMALWQQFARGIKTQQKDKIKEACERQLSRNLISHKDYFIGAGVGRFLVREIADELGFPYMDYSDLFASNLADIDMDVADCAPAVAVAILFSSQGE